MFEIDYGKEAYTLVQDLIKKVKNLENKQKTQAYDSLEDKCSFYFKNDYSKYIYIDVKANTPIIIDIEVFAEHQYSLNTYIDNLLEKTATIDDDNVGKIYINRPLKEGKHVIRLDFTSSGYCFINSLNYKVSGFLSYSKINCKMAKIQKSGITFVGFLYNDVFRLYTYMGGTGFTLYYTKSGVKDFTMFFGEGFTIDILYVNFTNSVSLVKANVYTNTYEDCNLPTIYANSISSVTNNGINYVLFTEFGKLRYTIFKNNSLSSTYNLKISAIKVYSDNDCFGCVVVDRYKNSKLLMFSSNENNLVIDKTLYLTYGENYHLTKLNDSLFVNYYDGIENKVIKVMGNQTSILSSGVWEEEMYLINSTWATRIRDEIKENYNERL